MKVESKVVCDFAKRSACNHSVSTGSFQLVEARRPIPEKREFDYKRLFSNEVEQSLCKDREARWSQRANELRSVAPGN